MRRHAAEALGTTSQLSSDGVAALAGVLTHEDEFLRRNAAIALARIGSKAKDATPALTSALDDHDRYVRGKAPHALRRIGTPEAQDALFHYLTISQWCYSTTKNSLY
jgi:HEAT repeat protein